ncbi:hypothetical protein ANOM_007237 [Aspergillus nomiae NRRL 13137]|uniref:Cytochrome P450 n=1 Tax=Aspergillus nomiae NRRL (strain ATCC 15546 / NRRL 13137 / CBS 260.88 / M93) TaxID=1509407 RepID=A0A0L1J1A9_ASPN3|nr:uncharacterized protein ANOM_007237 [Aspergillus nomiae NRRL 13137]KNG85596.1 hypothetical protein ANOM_007237 [Aspergillus nomiae NRRL 13137]
MDSILNWSAPNLEPAFQRLWTDAGSNIATLADPEQSWQRKVLFALVAIFIVHTICTSIYRPLTFLYESYFEIVKGGQYYNHVAKLHEQYGPLIRVSPHEVHWNDPEFIDQAYPTTLRKTDKPVWVAQRTGTPYSIVSTPSHDLHRRRRNALNSFFSVASVRRLEPILKTYMQKMMTRLETSGKAEKVVELHRVFKACASDIITLYAFGDNMGYMDSPDYGKDFQESTEWFFYLTHIFGLVPWLVQYAQNAPVWLVRLCFPVLTALRERQDWWINKVREIRASKNPERVKSTVFEGILNSSLPAEEKTDIRLASEAQLIVFAGEGTTGHPRADVRRVPSAREPGRARQTEERAQRGHTGSDQHLRCASRQPAVSGRDHFRERAFAPRVMNRQVRMNPDVPIVYDNPVDGKQYIIPPNTIYSMSPLETHMNPKAFGADPYAFRPQRWIEQPKLSKYFLGFSRGTRGCVGMTLARREMAMTLATLFTKYDLYRGQSGPTLELYDTYRSRDIDVNADYIIPIPAKGSKGLQVKIRN